MVCRGKLLCMRIDKNLFLALPHIIRLRMLRFHLFFVQFTEHVGRNYQPNYLTAWRKAGIIFMTHSLWGTFHKHWFAPTSFNHVSHQSNFAFAGGWHHVEVHDSTWWIVRMEAMGFVYSDILTKEMRSKAKEDRERMDLVPESMRSPDKKSYNVAQHIWGTLLVGF